MHSSSFLGLPSLLSSKKTRASKLYDEAKAYYEKSLSSKRSNIATMSCIDLNEFENFNNERM